MTPLISLPTLQTDPSLVDPDPDLKTEKDGHVETLSHPLWSGGQSLLMTMMRDDDVRGADGNGNARVAIGMASPVRGRATTSLISLINWMSLASTELGVSTQHYLLWDFSIDGHPLVFHHDGPFDACNPNRNRKGQRAAPMQAFPEDSTNMALGGAGPNNDKIDLDRFHGRMEEGYNDFASTGIDSRKTEGGSFDPTARIEPIHGAATMGLGTSTFLDGAPASRAAIRENQNEHQNSLNGSGGLQRKKSLAQRIRGGINRPNPRVTSPQAAYSSPYTSSSPRNEKNPFFQDYDDAWDKKGARINSEESRAIPETGRARSSSSPKQALSSLERRHTDDRSNGVEENKNAGGGGFISRMKSLRKPPQPKRRVTDD
ncbi:Pal1 cell morphology protein-domain-containing protein [Aspergillus desertorum]